MPDLKVISGAGNGDPELDLYFTRPAALDLIKRRRGVDLAEKTLANWAWSGKGPRWRRCGRRRVARGHDILASIDAILNPQEAA